MRRLTTFFFSLLCLVALATPATAGGNAQFPSEIDLPDGFFPEGIAVGRGSAFYVGSLADGSIYKGDLRTGEGAVLTDPTGTPFTTVGLAVDGRERVWAAGGAAGNGRVYDGTTGDLLATYQFTSPLDSLINDVIVTPEAAWFTDSGTVFACPGLFCGEPRIFKVALERGGDLPDPADPGAVVEIGVNVDDLGFANLNGIESMPGNAELIVAHTTAGALYRVDPATGDASVLYDDTPLARPDGIVRVGTTLYVNENAASQIAVIKIDPSSGTGTLQEVLPVAAAQTPSTSAIFGSAVYTVDARLGTPFQGPYKIFRIER